MLNFPSTQVRAELPSHGGKTTHAALEACIQGFYTLHLKHAHFAGADTERVFEYAIKEEHLFESSSPVCTSQWLSLLVEALSASRSECAPRFARAPAKSPIRFLPKIWAEGLSLL